MEEHLTVDQGVMGSSPVAGICPCSSVGKSTGFLNRESRVRIAPGVYNIKNQILNIKNYKLKSEKLKISNLDVLCTFIRALGAVG